MTSNAKEVVDW